MFSENEKRKRQEEYDAYMKSKAWRDVRNAAFRRAGFKCQQCGLSHIEARLECHHITYERFKKERPEDLIVLCPRCHAIADEKRRNKAKKTVAAALATARFEGWASKVYGDRWKRGEVDVDEARVAFQQWLGKK